MKQFFGLLLSVMLVITLLNPISASAKQADDIGAVRPKISVKVTDNSAMVTVYKTENAEATMYI